MADYRAIETTSRAIVEMLRLNSAAGQFDRPLEFEIYVREQFQNPMAAGGSLFLYRVTCNGGYRIPPGRRDPAGARQQTQLPLDLHYLVTVWAKDFSLQHRIAGMVLRAFEDTPILPSSILETVGPGVFGHGETVELAHDELSNEDLFRIWETLGQDRPYQLSIPYMARGVRIESAQTLAEGGPVQERELGFAAIAAGGSAPAGG